MMNSVMHIGIMEVKHILFYGQHAKNSQLNIKYIYDYFPYFFSIGNIY